MASDAEAASEGAAVDDRAEDDWTAAEDVRPGAGGPETVLVTGCSSGIGRATALAFREQGWRVYATAREEGDVEELTEYGCLTDELDVTEDRNVRRVVKRVATEAGRVDCLVNNAGYGQLGPIEEVPIRDVRKQFDVHVFGPYQLIQQVLPHMRERGRGSIVNVSSVLGRVAAPGTGVYSGSKFALEAMSDSLRAEVSEFGIDVVVVEPALVDTSFNERAARELDERETTTEYGWIEELFEDIRAVGEGGPFSVPPARVAAAVVNAASATQPAPRYPVGGAASLLLKARYLPDPWRDLLYRMVRRMA